MRDDCIALFLNSGMTQQQIHAKGGPTPQTISKWLYKETSFPRYQTLASFLRAMGYRFAILGADTPAQQIPKPLIRTANRRPKMPDRKPRKPIRASQKRKNSS